MKYTIRVAETKALISFAVTAKLICVFVFAYVKSRFSHDGAHFIVALPGPSIELFLILCNWLSVKLHGLLVPKPRIVLSLFIISLKATDCMEVYHIFL